MSPRANRRDQIVEQATRLFMEQGYHVTSVRQITQAAGCNEAALYYHFPDGKRALLQAIIENHNPELVNVLERCREAPSLYELIRLYGRSVIEFGPRRLQSLRWLFTEYHHLNDEERIIVQAEWLAFHKGFAALITQFVPDEQRASWMAWTAMCTSFGYGQLFMTMHMSEVSRFDADTLIEMIASSLVAYASVPGG